MGDISYDLLMTDDMAFAEGTYRIGCGNWQVFVVRKRPIAVTAVKSSTWGSGATGVVIDLPRATRLDKTLVERILAERFDVTDWVEVRGPDSMSLR